MQNPIYCLQDWLADRVSWIQYSPRVIPRGDHFGFWDWVKALFVMAIFACLPILAGFLISTLRHLAQS